MSKTIIVRLKKAGSRINTFSISDDKGEVLIPSVSKNQLVSGITVSIDDSVKILVISSIGNSCCDKSWNIPVEKFSIYDLSSIQFEVVYDSSMWRHLTDPTIYNKFYGCTAPYIIEYPFAYEFYDQILQNIKDYTKVYEYLPNQYGVFNDNRKIQTDDRFFNKAVLYNDQQSSGIINLVKKPYRDLSKYLTYPIYNTDSKTITFTKSDNFYQYNTFWDVTIDKKAPLFLASCESMSFDKEVNQSNMDYSKRSFKKSPLRAKDLKVRHILDDASDIHLVSQFLIAPAQISYK